MRDPSRGTTAGVVFNDLRKLARAQNRNTDELLVFYVLERFLYRLSRSPYADRLTLKGGLLLATLDARRPTRDGDLLALLSHDEAEIRGWITEITRIEVDDGVQFDTDELRSTTIRDGELYEGLRVTMPTRVGSAKIKLQLDINFGDPVTPGVIETEYPQLLADRGFPVRAYPIDTVIAEKLSTAIALGDGNTRERDWADMWRLTGQHRLDGSSMRRALERTAAHRGVELLPLSEVISTLPARREGAYQAWRVRQGVDAMHYPETLAELVAAVIRFADQLVLDAIDGQRWNPRARRWES